MSDDPFDARWDPELPSESQGSALSRRAVLSLPLVTGALAAAGVVGACAAPRNLPCASPAHQGAQQHEGLPETPRDHCTMRHCRHFRA
ncbi:MAG: hypothetical protein U0174_16345 [Polyangiaceae bacterium]